MRAMKGRVIKAEEEAFTQMNSSFQLHDRNGETTDKRTQV